MRLARDRTEAVLLLALAAMTVGQAVLEILAVASGKKTKSEELGYGDNEFVPWQIGATM